MFRWIVGKPEIQDLVLAVAVGLDVLRHRAHPRCRSTFFRNSRRRWWRFRPSLGLAAEEVENSSRFRWSRRSTACRADDMRSKTVADLSSIKTVFQVRDRSAAGPANGRRAREHDPPTLPTWSAPPVMLPPLSATSRCMKIGISSKSRSVIDLSMITYWTIRQRLLARARVWPTWPSGASGLKCCRCRSIRNGWRNTA